MLEIINDVLKAEKEAELLITEAREESQRLLAAFDQDERVRLQNARNEQNERVMARISQLRKDAEGTSSLREKEIHEKSDRFLEEREEALAEAAEAVSRLVLETRSITSG
jgi:vacuolar-type H+-ATPase subunit H